MIMHDIVQYVLYDIIIEHTHIYIVANQAIMSHIYSLVHGEL